MPRSRGSEVPQRQSPRGPHQLRTSSSDSDPPHHRPIADRSPKLGDRRSPRGGPHSDPVHQKKLGTRIADLESQLGQAQEELKVLKDQLVSAEAAKKEAQEELEKKTKKSKAPGSTEIPKQHYPSEIQEEAKLTETNPRDGVLDEIDETDVFEVPVEKVTVEPKVEICQQTSEEGKMAKQIDVSTEPSVTPEPEKASNHDLSLANEEITMLKTKLEEKEKELVVIGQENENLKLQLNEAILNISTAEAKKEEMAQNLSHLGEELKTSKEEVVKLKEKLEAVEDAKEALETEMKKLRVQTEQWRKAADAAAAVLAGGVEMNGRVPERCGSMDKHFGGVFEPLAGGYAGFVGSPGMADGLDDGFGSGKRKGSGIKKFGDLWKKKGNK
ncbi:interactor of constitutive active ROPs 1 [Mangifera indica]|uniref:interactor of constitutive active ROPs 1 n=1 Tax=Mangifera indica TaxID=29780 RepID=UPI001CFB2665|nr:interactor of constitutive active ROPs 1 [Mangifera indica]XP_044473949.1 interactor of constitutive active ROPs 1 [Mangifera indica]XP_044473950.1 interactor of constitutive active ROPs 1 [Mangifera indica]XP_044473951.1 interactor of constitutive active ROPs 1 [Mangifera indica]